MKTICNVIKIWVFVIILFSNSLFAQSSFLAIDAGYGFSMSSGNLSDFGFYNTTETSSSITYERVNVSLGKGINSGMTFGHMFNNYIGVEANVSYLFGIKTKATHTYTDEKSVTSFSSRMFRFNPSVIVSSGLEKYCPYAKLGLIVGYGSIIGESISNANNGDNSQSKYKLYGGFSFGISAGIGMSLKLNDKLSIFGDLNTINLSYAPTKGKLIKYEENGVDRLPLMTTNDKEIEFVNSYTRNFNTPEDDSKPSTDLKQKLPFGSIGFNIGLKINL